MSGDALKTEIEASYLNVCDRCKKYRPIVPYVPIGRHTEVRCPLCGTHLYGEPWSVEEPEITKTLVRY